MLNLNDPLDIMNIIIIIIASIEAAYLYKVTHKIPLLIYFIIFYAILVSKLMLIAPAEIIYLQAMVILLMIYTTYAMYKDKLWSLFVLSVLITVISMMFIYGLHYQTHGELVILVMALGWAWFKSKPVCYNPFKCEKYDLELNK